MSAIANRTGQAAGSQDDPRPDGHDAADAADVDLRSETEPAADTETSHLLPPATLRLRAVVEPGVRWPTSARDLVRGGLEQLRTTGSAEVGHVLAMLGTADEAGIDAATAALEAGDEPNLLMRAHGVATAATLAGDEATAVLLFAALAGWPSAAFDGNVALACVALRRGDQEAAAALADAALATGVRHATAYRIKGMVDLDRGDRRAAQSHLAMAARYARSDPRLREELRLAQRTLLLMHLT